MTTVDCKKHIMSLLAAAKIELPDMDAHCDRAVSIGMKDFWGSSAWSFRQKTISLTVTTNETSQLPEDFDSMYCIQEDETSSGLNLTFLEKNEFDRMIPKLSYHATGYPQFYTIYSDMDSNRKLIKFYPQPSGAFTLPMTYFATPPTDLSGIPDEYVGGLMAFIAKHAFPFGHDGRVHAYSEATAELKRLEIVDKYSKEPMTVMPDGTSRYVESNRWYTD